jgi:lysozyme
MNILQWLVDLVKPKTPPVFFVVPQGPVKAMNDYSIIKEWEKLRLTAYMPTPDDVWTIGWGHTKDVHPGQTISIAEAEALLRQDVTWVETAIDAFVTAPLSQNQRNALGSLIFNIGATQFAKSTVRRKLNLRDYAGCADAFRMWNKQDGKVLKGLVRRREQERSLFLK